MTELETHHAGISWFKESDWGRLKQVAEDADKLEGSWQEWQTRTLEMIEEFAKKNIVIDKVEVDVEELITWCETKEVKVNSSTRAEFVTEKMMQARKQTKN